MNNYISSENVPILALIEWCKNFSKFIEQGTSKITDEMLYFRQDYGFLPTDYFSYELNEQDFVHKTSIVYK